MPKVLIEALACADADRCDRCRRRAEQRSTTVAQGLLVPPDDLEALVGGGSGESPG